MDILIVGPYPPPLGGISVHVKRATELLSAAGYDVRVLAYAGDSRAPAPCRVTRLPQSPIRAAAALLSCAMHSPSSVVHVHASAMGRLKWLLPLLVLALPMHTRVLTLHSGSLQHAFPSRLGRHVLQRLLRTFSRVIVVSQEQSTFLVDHGVDVGRIVVIPAYLPEPAGTGDLPAELRSALGGAIRLCTSGYITRLYNYEVLAECIEQLPQDRYHFTFAFYNERDEQYESELRRRLEHRSNVTILLDQPPDVFQAILAHTDVYVRTALRDGDSVAVREALALGKRVLATDAVRRPAGCELFAPHDSDGLFRLITNPSMRPPVETSVGDSWQKLVSLYDELLRE